MNMHADGVSGAEPTTAHEQKDWHTPFTEGDRVDFNGAKGTVTHINEYEYQSLNEWPVHVTLDSGRKLLFKADGRQLPECEPVLRVIGKVPLKVKRWQWLMKNSDGEFWLTESTYTDEEVKSLKDFVAKVPETETEEIL